MSVRIATCMNAGLMRNFSMLSYRRPCVEARGEGWACLGKNAGWGSFMLRNRGVSGMVSRAVLVKDDVRIRKRLGAFKDLDLGEDVLKAVE